MARHCSCQAREDAVSTVPLTDSGFFKNSHLRWTMSPKETHQNHWKSVSYTALHSWYCVFYGFGYMYKNVCPRDSITHSIRTALKYSVLNLCIPPLLLIACTILNSHQSFCCSTSLSAFNDVSVSNFGLSSRCVLVSHCGLNMWFPDDTWCEASSFIAYLPFVYLLWWGVC